MPDSHASGTAATGAPRLAPTASTYAALARTIADAGLMRRSPVFYSLYGAALLTALVGLLVGFILLGDSWFQLLIAAAGGIVMTQFAFLTHEMAHRQVFAQSTLNDRVGRAISTSVVGVSYRWWMNKHTRHHANPNQIGADPDIDTQGLAFYEARAATRRGALAWIVQRQGYLFFPLTVLEGPLLHIVSVKTLLAREAVKGRAAELTFIGVRFAVYFTVLFWYLPFGMAVACLGVQLAVFGVYMSASFAPNHKGMPVLPENSTLDFLSKQVLTARNITGGYPVTAFMGGLNYQVEHHLFPSMPRPRLARARVIIKEYCESLGLPYTETTLGRSYLQVIHYLNRVGLAARDPFNCPQAATLGRE